jgi:hypothetical protein
VSAEKSGIEQRRRRTADAVQEAAEHFAGSVRRVGTRLKGTVAVESRGLLARLNVATHEDLRLLASRLDALDQQLDDLVSPASSTTS